MSAQEIIKRMSTLGDHNLDFKIAPEESRYVIGSNSINLKGEYYGVALNSINKPENQRNKRMFDIISAVTLLLGFPVLLVMGGKPKGLSKNIFSVLMGHKTWVSYDQSTDIIHLPKQKEGVLSPISHLKSKPSIMTISKLNLLYAKEYKMRNDLNFLLRNLNRLARY